MDFFTQAQTDLQTNSSATLYHDNVVDFVNPDSIFVPGDYPSQTSDAKLWNQFVNNSKKHRYSAELNHKTLLELNEVKSQLNALLLKLPACQKYLVERFAVDSIRNNTRSSSFRGYKQGFFGPGFISKKDVGMPRCKLDDKFTIITDTFSSYIDNFSKYGSDNLATISSKRDLDSRFESLILTGKAFEMLQNWILFGEHDTDYPSIELDSFLSEAQYQEKITAIKELCSKFEAIAHNLARGNILFIVKMASKHSRDPRELFELASLGFAGMVEGVKRYDPSKKTMLTTAVRPWVKRAILSLYNADSNSAEQAHADHFNKDLTDHRHLDSSALCYAAEGYSPWSYTENVSDTDDQVTSHDCVEQSTFSIEASALIQEAMSELNEQQQHVISMRYGIGMIEKSQSEVAGAIGLTVERIRQIEKSALQKLQTCLPMEALQCSN